jgi:hypothetical protein
MQIGQHDAICNVREYLSAHQFAVPIPTSFQLQLITPIFHNLATIYTLPIYVYSIVSFNPLTNHGRDTYPTTERTEAHAR